MDPEELTFKDLEQDIERCCVETGETMMGIPIVRGYDQARDFVFNAYLDNQQYQEVVDYLLKQNWKWGTNKYFDHASGVFVEGKEIYYIKQLWHGALAAQEQNYRATKSVRGVNKSVERTLRKSKQTGKIPPPVEESKCEFKGFPWEPEALPTRYPEIWEYYREPR